MKISPSSLSRGGSLMFSIALLAYVASAAATTAQAGSSFTPDTVSIEPPGNGKIAFTSIRDGNYEVYAMDADGSNQANITNHAASDVKPAWSPDGAKIAFASDRIFGDSNIWVMDANGSNPTVLTHNSNLDEDPAWSPDGTKIAFEHLFEVYVMNADGSNQIRLTNNFFLDRYPAWSPDGTKIAFTSSRDGHLEIYLMDVTGANQIRLTNSTADNLSPAWSPDGMKIAFTSSRDGNDEIYVMDPDGSNPIRLTNNSARDFDPAWSPDGAKIAFSSSRDGNNEIYVMDANGANQTLLTNSPAADTNPNWQRKSALPTPTPVPSAQALNISTRLRVETGNNVLIGGFIITGTDPKTVAVRGIGPSLSQSGISDVLNDPTLQLRDESGGLLVQNDNWQDNPASAGQLTALGIALQHPNESGIVTSLSPSAYTAILAGKNEGTGVGLVEIYDVNQAASSQLANISTRGFVLTGNNVMIGGFILGGGNNTHVVARGIGPSLADFGISPVLADPTVELHDGNGALLISNDNWQDDSVSASQISALGLAPSDPVESGIYASLPPGAFTAILAGKGSGTGIGLVEIFNVH